MNGYRRNSPEVLTEKPGRLCGNEPQALAETAWRILRNRAVISYGYSRKILLNSPEDFTTDLKNPC